MTIIKPLSDGSECIQVTLSDGQDEVRVHLHLTSGQSKLCPDLVDRNIIGLVVKNASRGLLYAEGDVVGVECES